MLPIELDLEREKGDSDFLVRPSNGNLGYKLLFATKESSLNKVITATRISWFHIFLKQKIRKIVTFSYYFHFYGLIILLYLDLHAFKVFLYEKGFLRKSIKKLFIFTSKCRRGLRGTSVLTKKEKFYRYSINIYNLWTFFFWQKWLISVLWIHLYKIENT